MGCCPGVSPDFRAVLLHGCADCFPLSGLMDIGRECMFLYNLNVACIIICIATALGIVAPLLTDYHIFVIYLKYLRW